MNPQVETALAFILFLPVFAILGALYCMFPREPRHARRRFADVAVLIGAALLSILAMRWGFDAGAGSSGGRIWQHIMATLLAYGVFIALLGIAIFVRGRLLRART